MAASGLLSLSITLIGLLFFTFMLTTLSPVDPALRIAGDHASESSLAQVRTDLGLDQPWFARFGRYLDNLRQGDLGVSITSGQPVLEGLSRALPATLELATLAILLGSTLGLSLGLLAAWRPVGWVDGLVRLVSLIGYSVPIFWLGLLMLLLFYARLQWAGGPGRLDDSYLYTLELSSGLMLWDTWRSGESGALANAFSHLVLPVLVLAFYSMAGICRMTRSALLGEMGKEYVVTALAKGRDVVGCCCAMCCRTLPGRWWSSLPCLTQVFSKARFSPRRSSPGRVSAATSPRRCLPVTYQRSSVARWLSDSVLWSSTASPMCWLA